MTDIGTNHQGNTPGPSSRALVIGIDGATWDLLNPLIDSGMLPNIARLRDAGSWGILESTIPPVTASAWSSFYTGRTPGNHGVFDFRRRMGSDSMTRRWVTSGAIHGPKLWEILNAQNKKTGLVNLPLTFPPVEVNGYMIGGMPVPPARDDIALPSGLIDEIKRETGGYISDVDLLRGESPDVNDPEKCFEFTKQVYRAVESRGSATRYLIEKYPTDFTFLVFVVPDRLCHLFWQVMIPSEEMKPLADWEVKLQDELYGVMRKTDEEIGRILEMYTDDDLVVIISDHGFGHLSEILKLNRLLEKLGYLKFLPLAEGGIRKKIGRILPEPVKKPLRTVLGLNRRKGNNGSAGQFDPYSLIDWSETMAYSGGSVEQGIFLNVNGREPEGTVLMGAEYHRIRDEIIAKLREAVHPDDNTPLFDWVEPRENVYSGTYTEQAPDIMYSLRGYSMVVGEDPEPPVIGPWSQPRAGYHRRDGILLVRGPMVEQGRNISVTGIQNVAPTILACMGLKSDQGMDGKIIRDALKPDFLDRYPPSSDKFEGSGPETGICDSDSADMEDLLKGLGYLN